MPMRYGKKCVYQTSDDFKEKTLGLQWQWNRSPRNDLWTLNGKLVYSERPFKLQMYAWRGCRVGVFTWNDYKESGYAEFKDFNDLI